MSEEQDAWVLRVLGVDVGARTNGPASVGTGAIPVGGVQFAKLRLQWQGAKASVTSELAQLKSTVEAELGTDPMIANLARLAEILRAFDEGLGDALDDLANADTPEKRNATAQIAEAVTERYIDHIVDDGLIEHVETNPFQDINVSGHLLPPLAAIQAALGTIHS